MKKPTSSRRPKVTQLQRLRVRNHILTHEIALLLAAEVERLNNDHVAINAERAETRAIRKEMIRAQNEVANLRTLLDVAEGALKTANRWGELGAGDFLPDWVKQQWLDDWEKWDQALAKIAATKSSDSPKNS